MQGEKVRRTAAKLIFLPDLLYFCGQYRPGKRRLPAGSTDPDAQLPMLFFPADRKMSHFLHFCAYLSSL